MSLVRQAEHRNLAWETITIGPERTPSAGSPSPEEPSAPPARAIRPIRRWHWAIGVGVLVGALVVATLLLGGGLGRVTSAASSLHGLHWAFLPALGALSALHYVCAALALRGASGRPLPLRQTTLTQFAAAAANRVTPGGLGGVAVNARYLACHGLPAARAVTTVAVLHAVGFPADVLLLLGLLGIGAISGGGRDGRAVLDTLGAHSTSLADRLPLIPLLVLAGLVVLAAAIWGRRALRSRAVAQAVTGMADLLRRPRDLLLTSFASATTTFVMGLALAVSVLAVPGAARPGDLLTLMTAYLVGAAAGAALPSPGGVGSTEATLVVALGAVGVSAGSAVQAVLLFRLFTYWAPVPVGLLAIRQLRGVRGGSVGPAQEAPSGAAPAGLARG